jgi:hypothetical protein
MAEKLIERTKIYSGTLIATGIIDFEDNEAAQVAVLLRATSILLEKVGIPYERIFVRQDD